MKVSKILLFITIAYSIAYAIDLMILFFIQTLKTTPAQLMVASRMFAPIISAIIATRAFKESIIESLKSYGMVLGRLKYISLALTIPFIIYLLSIAYSMIAGIMVYHPGVRLLELQGILGYSIDPNMYLLSIIVLCIVAGPTINAFSALGEEVGWRSLLLS